MASMLFIALLAAPFAHAQLTSVPDLPGSTTTSASSAAQSTTNAAATSDSSSQTTTTATFSVSSTSIYHLSDLPTVAGAGIPTLVIPYTAGAPFMQKSSLPEGTVFIVVGGILAFLGACVILWRGMVAYTVNRSVKRAAMASIAGSDTKTAWGGSSYMPSSKGGFYKDSTGAGSSMSLDALTSSGKPVKTHYKDTETSGRRSPSSALFFSPTAQATSGAQVMQSTRNSSYLPAGYYASTAAQAPTATTIGGSLAPYARQSRYESPPGSPGLPPTSRGSGTGTSRPGSYARATSRDGLNPRASSRDGLRLPSRDGYGDAHSERNSYVRSSYAGTAQGRSSYAERLSTAGGNHGLYAQPSSSSLMVGTGADSGLNLPGSRAPSAYFEDLLDEHGQGPRERF